MNKINDINNNTNNINNINNSNDQIKNIFLQDEIDKLKVDCINIFFRLTYYFNEININKILRMDIINILFYICSSNSNSSISNSNNLTNSSNYNENAYTGLKTLTIKTLGNLANGNIIQVQVSLYKI